MQYHQSTNPTKKDRNIRDPMSMFDRGARSSVKLDFVNQPNLTHQYQNLANNF